jgi:hypothetical protein
MYSQLTIYSVIILNQYVFIFFIEMENIMSPVHSVPETVIANITPSTSTTQPRKVPSNRTPLGTTSTLNPFTSVPSTSTVVSSSNRNRSRKQKNLNKDLGRWKPTDDLMLIHSVLQVRYILFINK